MVVLEWVFSRWQPVQDSELPGVRRSSLPSPARGASSKVAELESA
jgi:hypothetical protein